MKWLPLLTLIGFALPVSGNADVGQSGFTSEANMRNRLVEEARAKAASFENSGLLREAVDQWWIADALSPAGATAKENIQRLEARIRTLTAEAAARGWKAASQGKTILAQQSFLMVLQLDPGNQEALKVLRDMETASIIKELKKTGAEGPPAPVGPNT